MNQRTADKLSLTHQIMVSHLAAVALRALLAICLLGIGLPDTVEAEGSPATGHQTYADEEEAVIRVTLKNYTMFNLYVEDGQLSSEDIKWIEDDETWLPSIRRRIKKQHGSASFEAVSSQVKTFAGLLGFTGDNNIRFQLKVAFDGKDSKLQVFGDKKYLSAIQLKVLAEKNTSTSYHFTVIVSES